MLDDPTLERLTKLLGLLGSEHSGERAAAASKAHELLRAHGLDWAALIDLVRASLRHGPVPPRPDPSPRYHQANYDWQPSSPRDGRPGYWLRQDGVVFSVRQCRAAPGYPTSWTNALDGDIVTQAGRPVFYPSATAAQLGALAEALLR
jgi:hypothetical protein